MKVGVRFRTFFSHRLSKKTYLVINHEGSIGVLKGGVGGQNGVVRLNDGSRDLRSRIDRELQPFQRELVSIDLKTTK